MNVHRPSLNTSKTTNVDSMFILEKLNLGRLTGLCFVLDSACQVVRFPEFVEFLPVCPILLLLMVSGKQFQGMLFLNSWILYVFYDKQTETMAPVIYRMNTLELLD